MKKFRIASPVSPKILIRVENAALKREVFAKKTTSNNRSSFLLLFLPESEIPQFLPRKLQFYWCLSKLERVKGIEPSFQAWEAHVLPLNHTRVLLLRFVLAQRSAGRKCFVGWRAYVVTLAGGAARSAVSKISDWKDLVFAPVELSHGSAGRGTVVWRRRVFVVHRQNPRRMAQVSLRFREVDLGVDQKRRWPTIQRGIAYSIDGELVGLGEISQLVRKLQEHIGVDCHFLELAGAQQFARIDAP
jgi:hypothetical protein